MARMGAKQCERCHTVMENPHGTQKRCPPCAKAHRRDASRERMRATYARDAEKRRARTTAWRKRNPEKAREVAANWRASRADVYDAGRAAYRARRVGAEGDGSFPTWRKVAARDGLECHLCGGDTDPSDRIEFTRRDGVRSSKAGPNHPSLDHVTPLSLGGEHSMQNARIAHMRCNSSKGARNG